MLSVFILSVIVLKIAAPYFDYSYVDGGKNYDEKSFIILPAGANVIKLFTTSHNKLVFAPGNPFMRSLMFGGKARAYPSEVPFRCSTLG
jgi:hypothetical protein